MGPADPRKQQPQAGIQAADGAHRGAGVPAQGGLVHHHRGGEVVDALHCRFWVFGQPGAHERRVGGVHLALGLGGDGVENDAGFAGTGHTGKNRDFFFGYREGNMLQVVLGEPLYKNIRHLVVPRFVCFSRAAPRAHGRARLPTACRAGFPGAAPLLQCSRERRPVHDTFCCFSAGEGV